MRRSHIFAALLTLAICIVFLMFLNALEQFSSVPRNLSFIAIAGTGKLVLIYFLIASISLTGLITSKR